MLKMELPGRKNEERLMEVSMRMLGIGVRMRTDLSRNSKSLTVLKRKVLSRICNFNV